MQHLFTEYSDSLATIIQEESLIIIATDGTKSNQKSDGGRMITSSNGIILAHGSNPDFGSIVNMRSHRSEAYAVLSVFVFLSEYSKYFSLKLNNKCTLYCDNNKIVNKVQEINTTKNYFKSSYKMFEHEAIIAIQHYVRHKITIVHLYRHQDKIKGKTNLVFSEKLNDLTDSVANKYVRFPINNHIPFTPLAEYFNNTYLPNNYQYHFRRIYFQQDANEYFKSKCNWSVRASADIDWEYHIKSSTNLRTTVTKLKLNL